MFAFLLMAAGCIPVEGDKIAARDLAPSLPAFAGVAPEEVVGYSPYPGQQRLLRAAELQSFLRRHSIEAEVTTDVCVAWRMSEVTAESMREAMGRSLPAGTEVDIHEFSRQPAPAGEVHFPMSGLNTRTTNSSQMLWKGHVKYGGDRKFEVWARVTVRGECTRVVATQPLRPGARISTGQVRVETREGLPCPESLTKIEDVVDRVPRRFISAGHPVLEDVLTTAKEVARGDSIHVNVSSGAARVSFDGTAESAGAVGESIPVRNPATNKVVRARVEGPGRAVLALGAENR